MGRMVEMREILFRGKRLDNGEWIEGYYAEFKQLPNSCIYYLCKGHTLVADIAPSTVCQYTGLTDKDGRKIFEGDIVRGALDNIFGIVRYGEYRNPFENDKFGGHVGFYVEWSEKKNLLRKDLAYWAKEVDLIGNIFDNPELIGESQAVCEKMGGNKRKWMKL